MKPIQMVDLSAQYQKIKPSIDDAIAEVINTTAFINGPAVGPSTPPHLSMAPQWAILRKNWAPTLAPRTSFPVQMAPTRCKLH